MRALLVPEGMQASVTMHPQDEAQTIAALRLVPAAADMTPSVDAEFGWVSGYDKTGGVSQQVEYTVFKPLDMDGEHFARLFAETERII